MIRILARALILVASAAIGLLVANNALDDMTMSAGSLVTDVVIFAILQAVLAPFIAKVSARNAPVLLGGVGLITTLIALIVTTAFSDGLHITGLSTWVYASLIVWLVTMVAAFLLPTVLVVAKVRRARERRRAG